MRSGRTQQLLPHTHTHFHHHILSARRSQLMCMCVLGRIQEMELRLSHFEQHSTGRSEGCQTAFWDIIQPPTQQMCWAALSLARLSLGVFLLGKQHLKFAVYRAFSSLRCGCATFSCSFVYFSALLVYSFKYLRAVCQRSQKLSDVSGGRMNIQPQTIRDLR